MFVFFTFHLLFSPPALPPFLSFYLSPPSLQSFRWEQSRHHQVLTDRRRQATHLDPLGVPVALGPAHRPLGRAQSSPASTSLPPPPQPKDTPLSLAGPGSETTAKLRFTTGERHLGSAVLYTVLVVSCCISCTTYCIFRRCCMSHPWNY